MGGNKEAPTYQEVCTKTTGHAEVVEVQYDSQRLPTLDLLRHFFTIHNPTVDRRDKGGQYRSAIFFTNEEQQQQAQQLFDHLHTYDYQLSTELAAATSFWPADERHQQYCEVRGFEPRKTKGIQVADLYW